MSISITETLAIGFVSGYLLNHYVYEYRFGYFGDLYTRIASSIRFGLLLAVLLIVLWEGYNYMVKAYEIDTIMHILGLTILYALSCYLSGLVLRPFNQNKNSIY